MLEFARLSQRRSGMILGGLPVLAPPTGRYNCHGMVFASRRTNIPPTGLPNAVDIDEILTRDQYEKISGPAQPSDIVVYRAASGEIEHTGFVSRIDTLGSTLRIHIWSKWGALEEYEHPEAACPYDECKVEYWRLK
jgi:hypothetical protein